MSIIQVSSNGEVDNFNQADCFFLAEMSQPKGCKKWTNLFIGKDPSAQMLVAGDILQDGIVPYTTLQCVNALLESGQYFLETNLTIASTENMNVQVRNASPAHHPVTEWSLTDILLQDALHGAAWAVRTSRDRRPSSTSPCGP
jgi:hypothetical protein